MAYTLTHKNQAIIIQTSVLLGIDSISGYTDSTLSFSILSYFGKTFRYSDGINFSQWLPLTDSNLQSIPINASDPLLIEYRYEFLGEDHVTVGFIVVPLSLIIFSVTLNITYVPIPVPAIYTNTFLSQFSSYANSNMVNWCTNVLNKLYKPGIVARYIERGLNNNTNNEDEDYLAFWRTVTCYFSIFVDYARQFESFVSSVVLLREYIRQKGLFIRPDEDVNTLIYLMKNRYSEIRKRGTGRMVDDIIINGNEVDGEVLRIVNTNKLREEFIFALADQNKIGWCLGFSSPCYMGSFNLTNTIKAFEKSEGIVDTVNYELYNSGYCTAEIDIAYSLTEQILKISNVLAYDVAGIGYGGFHSIGVEKIIVDMSLDYEITFKIKCSSLINAKFSLGCRVYDLNGAPRNWLGNIQTGVPNVWMANELSPASSDEYFFVRAIIFNRDEPLRPVIGGVLNIGGGRHLKFIKASNKNAIIMPFLILDNSHNPNVSGDLYIADFKLRPINRYSIGFLNTKNIIISYMNNHSDRLDKGVDENLIEYMLPYDSQFINKYLPKT